MARSSRLLGRQVTNDEWLHSANPEEMVEACRAFTTKRKLRLFAAACFHRLEYLLPDENQRSAIHALEDVFAPISQGIVSRCRRALPDCRDSFDGKHAGKDDPYYVAIMLYRELVSSATGHHAASAARGLAHFENERVEQCKLLRCVAGNPTFAPRAIPLSWRNDEVVRLAETIYQNLSFDLLPRLGAEFEQSGCDDLEMLMHCRSSDPHVHGCCVIDTIVGVR